MFSRLFSSARRGVFFRICMCIRSSGIIFFTTRYINAPSPRCWSYWMRMSRYFYMGFLLRENGRLFSITTHVPPVMRCNDTFFRVPRRPHFQTPKVHTHIHRTCAWQTNLRLHALTKTMFYHLSCQKIAPSPPVHTPAYPNVPPTPLYKKGAKLLSCNTSQHCTMLYTQSNIFDSRYDSNPFSYVKSSILIHCINQPISWCDSVTFFSEIFSRLFLSARRTVYFCNCMCTKQCGVIFFTTRYINAPSPTCWTPCMRMSNYFYMVFLHLKNGRLFSITTHVPPVMHCNDTFFRVPRRPYSQT